MGVFSQKNFKKSQYNASFVVLHSSGKRENEEMFGAHSDIGRTNFDEEKQKSPNDMYHKISYRNKSSLFLFSKRVFMQCILKVQCQLFLFTDRQDPKSSKKHPFRQLLLVNCHCTRTVHNRSHLNKLSFHSIRFVDWCMDIWTVVHDLQNLQMLAFPFQPLDCMSLFCTIELNRNDCSTFRQPKSQLCNYALTTSHLSSKSDFVRVTKNEYPLQKFLNSYIIINN